ncbi:MAG: phosphoglycerate dehydrogenase [Deltaproteobacteria bacterium]|nr:phosphoglycerate dehydrogenase [Deltaproteobacteria bacterium]
MPPHRRLGTMTTATSYSREPVKVLLLENVSTTAVDNFRAEGFHVEVRKGSLPEAELTRALADVQVLGIRSKTQVTPTLLAQAPRLMTVGCFCIGTNQVALAEANRHGVPVFNAPFSNTRSVAELVIAEIVALSRQLGDRSSELHRGVWKKIATGCHEVRGRTLGIVGYGHIGTQVSILAESMGLRVIYYDIVTKMPLGNARSCSTLAELLGQSDFVTLHVPETAQTRNMIGPEQLAVMKPGACLLNASRGTVVQINALANALRTAHLAGAAVDVYPEEPESSAADGFKTELQGLPNVILTPHVGGSTEEAQSAIGTEVSTSLIKFVTQGATTGAVNFPAVELPPARGTHRLLNIHRNVPGVLKDINKAVSDLNANIHAQMLSTDPDIGCLVMDLDQDVSSDVNAAISRLSTSIKTRILY